MFSWFAASSDQQVEEEPPIDEEAIREDARVKCERLRPIIEELREGIRTEKENIQWYKKNENNTKRELEEIRTRVRELETERDSLRLESQALNDKSNALSTKLKKRTEVRDRYRQQCNEIEDETWEQKKAYSLNESEMDQMNVFNENYIAIINGLKMNNQAMRLEMEQLQLDKRRWKEEKERLMGEISSRESQRDHVKKELCSIAQLVCEESMKLQILTRQREELYEDIGLIKQNDGFEDCDKHEPRKRKPKFPGKKIKSMPVRTFAKTHRTLQNLTQQYSYIL